MNKEEIQIFSEVAVIRPFDFESIKDCRKRYFRKIFRKLRVNLDNSFPNRYKIKGFRKVYRQYFCSILEYLGSYPRTFDQAVKKYGRETVLDVRIFVEPINKTNNP